MKYTKLLVIALLIAPLTSYAATPPMPRNCDSPLAQHYMKIALAMWNQTHERKMTYIKPAASLNYANPIVSKNTLTCLLLVNVTIQTPVKPIHLMELPTVSITNLGSGYYRVRISQ